MRTIEERVFGYLSRDNSWLRRRRPREKWPRWQAEIPPEMSVELDARIGKQNGPRSRADIVNAALRIYLEIVDPEGPEVVEAHAIELPVLKAGRYLT